MAVKVTLDQIKHLLPLDHPIFGKSAKPVKPAFQPRPIYPQTNTEPTTTRGSWKFELLGYHPPSLNQFLTMHFANRMKASRSAHDQVYVAKLVKGIPEAHCRRRVDLVFYKPKGRPRDEDNCRKIIHDALVSNRLLVDDSPQWVEQGYISQQKGDLSLVIILTDVENVPTSLS